MDLTRPHVVRADNSTTVKKYVFPSALGAHERSLSDNLFSPSLEKVAGRLARSRLLTGPCGLAFKSSPIATKRQSPKAYALGSFVLCAGEDLNLQALAGATTSR